MDIDKAFPSKYLRASDFNDDDTLLTIKSVAMEQVNQDDERPIPIVYFDGAAKGLVCKVTNKNIIKKLYGKETDNWIGKKIALYINHDVMFKGETVSAIRVRSRAPVAVSQPVRQSEVYSTAAATQQSQNVKDPQALSFIFTAQGLNADEHVNFLLEAFGYASLEAVPEIEQQQFLAFVQNRIQREAAT